MTIPPQPLAEWTNVAWPALLKVGGLSAIRSRVVECLCRLTVVTILNFLDFAAAVATVENFEDELARPLADAAA